MVRKPSLFLVLASLIGVAAAAEVRAQDCFSPPEWSQPEVGKSGDANGDRIEDELATRGPEELVDVLLDLNACPSRADLKRFAAFGEIGFVGRYLSVVQLRGVPAGAIAALAADPRVAMVEVDHPVTSELVVSVRNLRVRASTVYSPNTAQDRHPEITGTGVNIAIVDSGVDDGVNESLPAAKFVGGYNALTHREENPDDAHGHGTHVAGIALGIGGPVPRDFRGVAPGAGLVDIRVLNARGFASDTSIMEGVEKCIEKRVAWRIGVMNLSVTNHRRTNGLDALSQAVNRAVRDGIVAVVAAGNSAGQGIMAPATADDAIVVASSFDRGTVTRNDDVISRYSSRGPRLSDHDADTTDELKPDVAAPGEQILSAKHNTLRSYAMKSGTSMSAPHVAGLAALILQANPGFNPTQVRQRILGTAQDFGPAGWDIRWGRGLADGNAALP